MPETNPKTVPSEWIPTSMAEPTAPANNAAPNGVQPSNGSNGSNGTHGANATKPTADWIPPSMAEAAEAPAPSDAYPMPDFMTPEVLASNGAPAQAPVAPRPIVPPAATAVETRPAVEVTPVEIPLVQNKTVDETLPNGMVVPPATAPATTDVKPATPAVLTEPEPPAPKKRRLPIPLIVLALIVIAYFVWQYATTNNTTQTISGTIEATEIRLGSQIGGEVKKVRVNEGDRVTNGEDLIDVYSASGVNEAITSPIDGTVLERLIEPGEIVPAGSTLMVVADLSDLTLTVYVPEDHYGQVALGQNYNVHVDSFPDQTFAGTVSHIADQAEFTPRNVQTIAGRESTVFAIKLNLAPTGGKLKPGMPADVDFEPQ